MRKEIEEWRDVPKLEGRLQVSTLGRVRSLRVLKHRLSTSTGYPVVSKVHEDSLTAQPSHIHVHALVARTFIGPRPAGMHVNHIDGDRQNNVPKNLEYVTVKENSHHAFKIGNRKHYFTEKQMDRISDWFFKDGISVTEIARRLTKDRDDVPAMKRVRKKVRSVIGIWRASQREGRKNPYERHLTWEDVDRMRDLHATGNVTQKELGEMFRCHPAHISRVVNKILWPDSERPIEGAAQ